MERENFHELLQLPEEDLRKSLLRHGAVATIAYDEKGEVAGSLLASLFVDEIEELKNEADPDIEDIPGALHIYSIAVRADLRGKGYFSKLIKKFREEHPGKHITAHANTVNNCSIGMQKHGARFVRRIDNWYGTKEPFDYLIFDPLQDKCDPPIK